MPTAKFLALPGEEPREVISPADPYCGRPSFPGTSEGNSGAIGIRHRAAQGGVVADTTVFARDAFAGLSGGPGSGGSSMNVTVIGGRYGIDYGESQPAATVVGFTLVNQTCAAVMYCGLMTLSVVGMHASTHYVPNVTSDYAAVVAGMCGNSGRYGKGHCAHTFSHGASEMNSQISITDSSFELLGAPRDARGPALIVAGSQASVQNTYVRGFGKLAYFNGPSSASAA